MSHPTTLPPRHSDFTARETTVMRTAKAIAAATRRRDYTFVHAGRQVRLGPVAFWIVVGTLVIMAGWSIATGTYFAFRDDVLTRLIARQAEMQYAYEDRIAELRAQVDRITSRQLLDQEQFEQKLDGILKRQSVLESRSSALGNIGGDALTTGSIPRGRSSDATPTAPLKPSPISDTVIFVAPPDREARLESRVPLERPAAPRALARAGAGGLEGMLSRMTVSLDRIEAKQTATLNSLEETYDGRLKRMRGVLADLGVNPGRTGPAPAGIGGPFVPLKAPSSQASAFERQIYRINLARAEVDRYTRTLVTVPVRKPVFGDIDMSSPFGMRMDPFVKGPAIHTGLDMRGDVGDPVRVTANGTVTTAGWNGGYGKMVEVDHGNGLSTRYGHLSEIDVRVGQRVRLGEVIGKIGSTGRSTGPHLHYETRINDEAVDPQRFLRAGVRLGTM
jgi:murein DD-endopeptidase MepM/ murein hydrolase activator NlpD